MAVFTSGFLLFPGLTQLDLTGPYEVLSRLPHSQALLIAATLEPVRSDSGLSIVPTVTFDTAPRLDLLCVPGGPGTMAAAADPATLDFVKLAEGMGVAASRAETAEAFAAQFEDAMKQAGPRLIEAVV